VDYPSSLERLLSLADLERMVGPAHHQPRYHLDRMRRLLQRLGNPQEGIPIFHIAGTKGKGSVCAFLASVLRCAGYRVGLYTSPHLHTFRERIQIDGEPLSPGAFAGLVSDLWPAVEALAREGERVTVFEALTAMAFLAFRRARCEVAVVEVGLGGRLDATNVARRPLVCAITPISHDHTAVLGTDLADIAREKAGILRPGRPVVCAPQPAPALAVVEETARRLQAPLFRVDRLCRWERGERTLEGQAFRLEVMGETLDLWTPLLGAWQVENCATALLACWVAEEEGLPIPRPAWRAGTARARWPGRLEVLVRRPLVVVDGAHNPASAQRLAEAVREDLPHRRLLLVFGASRDKDVQAMAEALAPLADRVLACRSRHPRAGDPSDLADLFLSLGVPAIPHPTVADALRSAMAEAGPDDLVLVTGSLFVVAEAREHLLGIPAERYPQLERPPGAGGEAGR